MHLSFFAEHVSAPHEEDMEKVEHDEMEGAESVDVEHECRKFVEIERSLWRRYTELKFVRKVEVDKAMEDEVEEATDEELADDEPGDEDPADEKLTAEETAAEEAAERMEWMADY
jgi:hypothetical protein